jgi:hypothetical protein
MNRIFKRSIAGDLHGFLQFKRSLGFRYARAEFTLREFDRFLVAGAQAFCHWSRPRSSGYRANPAGSL